LRRLALLAAAAAAYVFGAWLVAPGFFDGFAPAQPYHWVSPPPELRNGNQPPSGGRTTIAVQNGVAQAGHLYTGDQQAAVTFPSQSFEVPADRSPITLQIQPVATYPDLGGVVPAGNVYLVTGSTRLISPVIVTLRYGSQQSGPPSQVFAAGSPSSGWRPLVPVNTGVPYTVAASTQALGYFVVGFPPAPSQAPAPASGAGGPPLGLVVAVAAAALIVAGGVPLIMVRGRAGGSGPEEAAVDARPPPAAAQNLGGARRRGRRRGRR
jgi:hypothetical protein